MSETNRLRDEFFFGWDRFQDHFFSDHIWKDAAKYMNEPMPWVEQYVQEILSQVMPTKNNRNDNPNPFPHRQPSAHSQVFETHDYVIARIPIPEQVDFANLRIFISFNRLLIKGLANEEEWTVDLPVCVRPDKSKAICKNRILEVRMPKEQEEHPIELPIRFL